MGFFTDKQVENINAGYHPDCGDGDPCKACGATLAAGACAGKVPDLPLRLWRAAYRHDHNNDPSRVLHTSGNSDAALLDSAARALIPLPQ